MNDFVITIDSSCDGNLQELYSKDVDVIFYYYSNGTTEYLDDMDMDKGLSFFNNMRNGTSYSTSQLNQYAYYDFFKKNLIRSKNIIHISLTEGLSGSINQARLAAKELMNEDKSIRITPIDSLIACNGELVLLDKAIELRDNGTPYEEAVKILNEFATEINTYFTTNTLTYFVRGGRLSKATGFIGSVLRINPVLVCAPNGNLKVDKQVRGKKSAANYILEECLARVINPEKQYVYICHADNLEGAYEYEKLLVEGVGFKGAKIYQMGPIIGSHTGPGLIAIFFHGKKRGLKIK